MFCEINQKTRTIDQHFAENFEKLNIPMHAGGADVCVKKPLVRQLSLNL